MLLLLQHFTDIVVATQKRGEYRNYRTCSSSALWK